MLAPSRPRDLHAVEAFRVVAVDLGPRQAADRCGSPGRQSQAEPADRLLEGVRVLVVEDETIVALDLIQMLEDLGADVCGSAASGADALSKARALRPELAVVDIRLKDGETGVDAARSMAEELGTVIVFATAHTDPLLRTRMETVLGSTHLPKPYGVSELEDAARRVLRRQ